MVICLELGADMHMAQLIPLPLTVSSFSKIQVVILPFCYRLTRVVPEKGPLNGCVYMYIGQTFSVSGSLYSAALYASTVNTVAMPVCLSVCLFILSLLLCLW